MALEHIKNWSKRAKCRDTVGEDIFFPDTRSGEGLRNLRAGKEFCTDCPVISQCKIYAIAHGVYGIWGGTSKAERDKFSPLAKEAVRAMYREEGQLEPLNYHIAPRDSKRLPELLVEQEDPIFALEIELDPTSTLLIQEDDAYTQQSM
jgi:WhiB family redox-sensing transcriptional regulator